VIEKSSLALTTPEEQQNDDDGASVGLVDAALLNVDVDADGIIDLQQQEEEKKEDELEDDLDLDLVDVVCDNSPVAVAAGSADGAVGRVCVGLTIDLHQLPFFTCENCEIQTSIGARGWYSSAVLSVLLMSGHPLIMQDLQRGLEGNSATTTTATTTMIELGSGSVGLSGMALAWVTSQLLLLRQQRQQQQGQQQQQQHRNNAVRVVLTDYDDECLDQLRHNTTGVQQRLDAYYHHNDCESNNDDDELAAAAAAAAAASQKVQQVQLSVEKLDWNDYDRHQPLLEGNEEDQQQKDQEHGPNSTDFCTTTSEVTFVCGAALVYCHDTVACSDQVIKILRLHPHAVVWIVQVRRCFAPRNVRWLCIQRDEYI
jgi:hypothetical protein